MSEYHPCTFEISSSPCTEDGRFYDDMEDFYCPRHAEALRSLQEEPPLARLDQVGNGIRSPFGILTLEESIFAVGFFREEYPDAIEIRWISAISSHTMWLRREHRFLELCGEEELQVESRA